MSARAGGRRRKSRAAKAESQQRNVSYHELINPFPPLKAFSDDKVNDIHEASLRVLQELGIKVLLPEAREIFAKGGAKVDTDTDMVYLDRDMVEAAIASTPKSFKVRGGSRDKDITLELGRLVIQCGAGCPHATDMVRGRRPGSLEDFRELIQLNQHFDVLHMLPPIVEPQDVPLHLRHYATTETMLTQSTKIPHIFSRGTPQIMDAFEMIRDFRGLSDEEFQAESHCYSIINTNSPRQLDIPMAQGLIDFAKYGQTLIITPFTLMGAMAPVTVAGALTLSHAEAMAAITLTQLVNPGAPVCYGSFTSNVDMKSGSPAFGTPEEVKASLGTGQLARLLGLPWRCAAGSAANVNDAQAAHETSISAWASFLAGSTIMIHGAGWLEGGLSISYEKLITDVEMLQVLAELCIDRPADDDDIAFDALAEVQPGGHFFAAQHTMERYSTAFYEPMIADWSNFETWQENGSRDASTRACDKWQQIIHEFKSPVTDEDKIGELQAFVARRTEEGGALPVS